MQVCGRYMSTQIWTRLSLTRIVILGPWQVLQAAQPLLDHPVLKRYLAPLGMDMDCIQLCHVSDTMSVNFNQRKHLDSVWRQDEPDVGVDLDEVRFVSISLNQQPVKTIMYTKDGLRPATGWCVMWDSMLPHGGSKRAGAGCWVVCSHVAQHMLSHST